jgi:hypothetical protein
MYGWSDGVVMVMLPSVDLSKRPAPSIEEVGKNAGYFPIGWSSMHYGIVIDV